MNALSDGWPTWSIGWVHRAGEKAVAPGFYSSAGTYCTYFYLHRSTYTYLARRDESQTSPTFDVYKLQIQTAWVGDGNNVIHDLMLGGAKLGMNIRIATPDGYEVDAGVLETTKKLATENGTEDVFLTTVASEAAKGSDVVVTDTWVSMGQEAEYEKRVKEFDGYQVNASLMKQANPGAVFLHCLPRHQEEVSDDVFYSDQSLVFPEAENRMWTVMAVMAAQLGKL